jgi:hypothetical protein
MKSSSIKVLLLTVAVLSPMSVAVFGKGGKPYLSVTISAAGSVKAGTVAIVNIAVTNTSSSAIAFSSGYREDQCEFGCDFSALAAEGKAAPKTRYMNAVYGKNQGPGPQLDISGKFIIHAFGAGRSDGISGRS